MTSAGQFGDIRKMWFNKGGIATIVPLKQIKTIWPVSYDTRLGNDFVIYTDGGDVIAHTNPKGMPYLDLRDHEAAIALGLEDNIEAAMGGLEQGTYKFFSLTTSKKIKRRNFTPYPMPDSVITKAKTYGVNAQDTFYFANRNGILFMLNKDLGTIDSDELLEEDVDLYPLVTAEFPGVALVRDITAIKEELEPHGRIEDLVAINDMYAPVDATGVIRPHVIPVENANRPDLGDDNDDIIHIKDVPPFPASNEIPFVIQDDDAPIVSIDPKDNSHDDINEEPQAANNDQDQGVRRYPRQGNRGVPNRYNDDALLTTAAKDEHEYRATLRDGICLFTDESLSDAKPVPVKDRETYALGVALITYSIGAGIKKFKEKGEAGVTKEFRQMHDIMSVFQPIMKKELTAEERKKALASLMFLKQKRDLTVKARMCADGRGQRNNWEKKDTTSPTVSTESVFITAVIDATEGRDVAYYDIPGAFLHSDTDEDITMIL